MTTAFAFVPRAVSKYTKEWQGISRSPPSTSTGDDQDDEPDDDDDDPDNDRDSGLDFTDKEKTTGPAHSKQSTEDIASLISLALSDYNIWLDPDLRWKLDACLQDDISPDDAAFVPINYLLRRPPFRGALPPPCSPEPPEIEVAKSLRLHASRPLEVRMRLSLPSSSFSAARASSVWYGSGKTSRKKDVGGYEIRRRDWETLRDHPSREWTRARWDNLTAYMECIPPQYRTIGGIARFAESLLSAAETDADVGPHIRVQCITLPPHYLDKPGNAPKCKGYALVTFSTKSDLETILRVWPWRRRVPDDNSNENASSIMREARKHGLRAISKARWDTLNEEYLAYKQTLVEEVARAGTGMQQSDQGEHTAPPQPQTQTQVQTTSSSRYPLDCLVFVRNIHPDTNKTILKSLFIQAFQDQDQNQGETRAGLGSERGHASTTVLDYVDFNRGMDTCYLRLASPSHTTHLLDYFTTYPTTQAHGLDATGRTPFSDDKPITMERVQRKREELYWEKIPDKVKRQAVDRVVHAQLANGVEEPQSVSTSTSASTTDHNGASGSRRKKRTHEC